MPDKDELKKKADVLGKKIAQLCVDFTSQKELLISDINFACFKNPDEEYQYSVESHISANEFNLDILENCADFTKETGSLITELTFTSKVVPFGDSGQSNIEYNVKLDFTVPNGPVAE